MATDNTRTNKNSHNTKQAKQGNTNKKAGMMNMAVTGFVWYHNFKSVMGILFGVLMVSIGVYIRSYNDVLVTLINAKTKTVKWGDKYGCESHVVKTKNDSNVRWRCNVVTTYNDEGEEREYKFSSDGMQYFENQAITLYRRLDDGTISHIDPNAWKTIGWFLIGFGLLLIFGSLFWLWICTQSWGRELCAAKGAVNMVSGAFKRN